MQDYGEAIERAESGNVPLTLKVVRPGTGGVTLSVTLPNAGAFGAAYPLGSPKFDAIYEQAIGRMHTKVMDNNRDPLSPGPSGYPEGYIEGWMGICLLSHPNWNDTTGPKPYRLSINKVRDWAVARLNAAILEPLEENQPGFVASSPGLENWHLSTNAMFLAEYRLKSGDTSVNATVQRAAELLAKRVQYWQQPDLGNGNTPNYPGMMGHAGVTGDYIGTVGLGGINIINAHANLGMGLLKTAGADFSGVSGQNAGTLPHIPYTFQQRHYLSWEFQKACTETTGGDAGNVGYFSVQGGFDSSGRTAGAVAAFPFFTDTPTADDTEKYNLMRAYLSRHWERFQNAHVVSIAGVTLYQMALPRLPDRDQRYIMENARHFYQLHRKADGTLEYFGARTDYDSDLVFPTESLAIVNTGIARAVAGGTLPNYPPGDSTRLYSFMKTPWVSWPTLEAHAGKINGSAPATLEVEITDYLGAPVTSGLTAAWTKVSGPGTVNFGSPAAPVTTATFSADGLYRLQLVASKGGYTLTEPYDFTVTLNPVTPPAPTAPAIMVQPANVTTTLGSTVTFTLTATGTGPLVYQWRLNGATFRPPSGSSDLVLSNIGGSLAGDFDCVVTGPGGSVTSDEALLTLSDATLQTGGMWRSKFQGPTDLAMLRALATYPNFPDSGAATVGADKGFIIANEDGQHGSRWTAQLHVDVTGDYRLLSTSGGNAGAVDVWLSTDQHPLNKVKRITANAGETAYRAWSTASASPYVTLVAGQRYYLEFETANWDFFAGESVLLQKQGDPLPADGTPGTPGSQLEYVNGGIYFSYLQPTPQQFWQEVHFTVAEQLNNAISGPTADPDRDGIVNILERALHLPPRTPSAAGLPTAAVQNISSTNYLTLTFRRLPAAVASDLTYPAQTSGNLLNPWVSDAVLVGTPVNNGDGSQTVTYRDSLPISGNSPRFMRLEVTLAP